MDNIGFEFWRYEWRYYKKFKKNSSKKQIKVIIEKDEGIYYAMNKGIEICN